MASLRNKKSISSPPGNGQELVKVTYDFAYDTGAQADYDVLENTGQDGVIVEHVMTIGETTCAGVNCNLDLGKAAGGTEFQSDFDGPTITADYIMLSSTANTKVELTNGEKIVLGIETADLTAGKFHMYFRIYKKPY